VFSLKTIKVVGNVKGVRVALVDDIATTSTTMRAFKQLLEEQDAIVEVMFVLGYTSHQ
jgi:predicted amidophosphoribosyltransferase